MSEVQMQDHPKFVEPEDDAVEVVEDAAPEEATDARPGEWGGSEQPVEEQEPTDEGAAEGNSEGEQA